jgi:hypothetical protein
LLDCDVDLIGTPFTFSELSQKVRMARDPR